MRAAPIAAAVLSLFVASLASHAEARPKKKKVKDEPEDISSYKKDLVVLTDDDGDVYVMEGKWGAQNGEHVAFFGDGKTMYRQRIRGGGADGSTGRLDLTFWSPRSDTGSIGRDDKGAYYLQCGRSADAETFPLKKMSDADSKKVLDTAKFLKPFWKRQAQALARDDAGNYYYVDRMQDDHGGKGHRIFAGPKGGLKELPMTNVVSDSVGEIYATRKGELRFVTSPNKAWWIKGSVKNELTIIPIEDNIALIYGDLGVYDGSLGTPCDDM
jgi:hypothetical protein